MSNLARVHVYTATLTSFCFAVYCAAAPSIAFSVVPGSCSSGTILPATTYVNVGGAYNNITGIFTAPKAGLYFFEFHLITVVGGVSVLFISNGIIGLIQIVYLFPEGLRQTSKELQETRNTEQ